ncbi:hypothetical protein PFISCL1PPCAC_5781, partial [Pristionchus fissidentatus]
SGEPGVQFGPQEKGGLPGGDYNMSQACQPSTSTDESTVAPLALTYHHQDTGDLTPRDENDHKYVGLVNQAMTCYLNSLLQTLYMTPEFRNAIYRWEYTSNRNEQQSIPCQLQKLFLLLQTSEMDSLETKELTAAFGWSSNEAYDQHDVQELCRLMFDALEMRWKKSNHEKLIEELYRGSMEDFVACLSCGRESVKSDVFLDLPLAVKPFGATEAFKSVEEALAAFVQPELLDGNNQYMCENCKSKQNAHKGLRITSFPYLLTIQLKRFDFDYTTFNRIKLNDRVSFPDLLDLNQFVHKVDNKKEVKEENGDDSPSITPMDEDTIGFEIGKSGVGHRLDMNEAEKLLQKGPYVYELFSVMVHQGNAAGGHYFAYIKNVDVSEWYCFNDTRVEIATPQEVEKSFGGMQGGWTNSNTNAYMLMYRQVKKDKNASFIRTIDLPRHIVDLKQKWKEQEEKKETQRKYEENLLRLKVYANGIVMPPDLPGPLEMSLPRDNTVETLLTEASKGFALLFKQKGMEGPSKKNIRLIHCSYGKIMKEAFISPADKKKKLSSLLQGGQILNPKDLYFIFDTKKADQPCFTPIDNYKKYFTCQIHLVKIKEKRVEPAFLFPIAEDDTITRIRELLGSYLCERKDFKDYRIVLERGMDKFDVLDSPGMQFGQLFRADTEWCVLYVDGGSPGEETNADRRMPVVQRSLMCQIIDRHKYSIKLRIEIPSQEDLSDHKSSMEIDEMGETPFTPIEEPSNTMEVIQSGVRVEEIVPPPSLSSSTGGEMEEDYALSGESVCNNTPQMSPVVSEGEEMWESTNQHEQHQQLVDKITSLSNFAVMENVSHPYETDDIPSTTSSKTIVQSESGKNGGGGTTIIHLLEEKDNVLLVDVDKRDRVKDLRNWLAHRCGIDSATFSFHVCYGENGISYESSSKDEEALDSWKTVHKLVMKLRPALKENEKMVKVYRFEMEEMDKDKWRLLYEIPLSANSLVSEVKRKCQRLFRDKYQENLEIDQIHLRCMKQKRAELGDSEKVNERLNVSWSDNLYVHIIPIDRLEEVKGGKQAVFVRRFRPSTVELDKIDFVVVDPSLNGMGQLEMFKEAISHRFHISVENLEFIAPNAWGGAWPTTKLRTDLHENATWVESPVRDQQILQMISCQVVYFRDKSEEKMKLTDEARKLITIKDRGQQEAPVRRKERALRIQMNSFSES